jgi:hypothetical protein
MGSRPSSSSFVRPCTLIVGPGAKSYLRGMEGLGPARPHVMAQHPYAACPGPEVGSG